MIWLTPPDLYAALDREFNFTLDACADSPEQAQCRNFYSPATSLSCHWHGRVWLNPPYGRLIHRWVHKAHNEVQSFHASLVCALLPVRTDTHWWEDYVTAADVWYIPGRLSFGSGRAPWPCCTAVWRNTVLSWSAQTPRKAD